MFNQAGMNLDPGRVAARVLLIADANVLPRVAAGLREGDRFEVATATSPEEALAMAGEPPQAVLLFYGCPQWTLPAALQALRPLRDKGAQLVAVLQRQQLPQRDECFRSGASDALFMPIPTGRFVGKLADSLSLAYREESGAPATVQVASTMPAELEATVTADGVHGSKELPFEQGQTVRLSWESGSHAFAAWGLVARAGAAPQVRFAGLTPDEEARIRAWVMAAGLARGPDAATPAPAPRTLDNLFDDAGAAPAAPAADEVCELELGSPWPNPWPIDWCRRALRALLRREDVPAGPEGGEAIARIVVGRLTVAERAAAENGWPASRWPGPSPTAKSWPRRAGPCWSMPAP
jgi:CheY-like chemotaxis protein